MWTKTIPFSTTSGVSRQARPFPFRSADHFQCAASGGRVASSVRVLLRHSVVVASPKRIVINHTQLFTIRFGTSVSKSKSGSYISLFLLELSLPNRKEKADLPQFVLEQIEKPRTFRSGTCPPNRREDAKAEIGFTIRYGTWSWSRKDQRHFSINHFPIRIETRNKNSAFKLDTGCHEGLRFANLKLDRFSPGWRSQGQWAWCGWGIEVSTIQRRLEASI